MHEERASECRSDRVAEEVLSFELRKNHEQFCNKAGRADSAPCASETRKRNYFSAPRPIATVADSFIFSSLARLGSKQRRQRASYIPAAPTTTTSSLPTSRCVCFAGFPHCM